ncbi:hypothetical protein HNP46_005636 [Pseudomonas nitritireducens]|uniref:Uncharacterized protein n=1 Tax=Pseudomonas nitroreducens TaxID=46680 RepID=A0A7W7KPS9_PSENT|nr:hypothetical protein [Pseudomonas nitritireducens]MBB4866729.1 hypothetical protein [Pseudomonas nitritireducens]
MKSLLPIYQALLRRGLIALSSLASLALAAADSEPPEVLRLASAQFTVGEPVWHSLILGNAVSEAKLTSLQGARSILGAGEIRHDGVGDQRRYWLCYHLPHARQGLWLLSEAKRSDGSHHITRIALHSRPDQQPGANCPPLHEAQQWLTLDGYAWIGASSAEVQSVMGVATLPADGWWRFEHHRRLEGRCDRTRYRTNWLWLHFANGRVDGIDAGQISNC